MCHPHGMGNPPSDLPELSGLLLSLAPRQRREALVLAGHKANFGHSVCAAGVISLALSTLTLQHGVVPVHLGVVDLVPILEKAQESMFLPVQRPMKLNEPAGEVWYGSVSGTSVSGDNVHLVLKQLLDADESVSELETLN